MKVLVAEDEPKMARLLHAGLSQHGHVVDLVNNGMAARESALASAYDVIVLDVMMPMRDGFEVCKSLREEGICTPILMVTARDAVQDRVRGLDAGADDYIVKPFALDELLARMRALVRRSAEARSAHLEVHGLLLDNHERAVTRNGRVIRLTTTEFALLRYLMERPGEVISRERLLEDVWGWGFEGSSNVVNVYIRYLRGKIGSAHEPALIHTVRGVGYVLGDDY